MEGARESAARGIHRAKRLSQSSRLAAILLEWARSHPSIYGSTAANCARKRLRARAAPVSRRAEPVQVRLIESSRNSGSDGPPVTPCSIRGSGVSLCLTGASSGALRVASHASVTSSTSTQAAATPSACSEGWEAATPSRSPDCAACAGVGASPSGDTATAVSDTGLGATSAPCTCGPIRLRARKDTNPSRNSRPRTDTGRTPALSVRIESHRPHLCP